MTVPYEPEVRYSWVSKEFSQILNKRAPLAGQGTSPKRGWTGGQLEVRGLSSTVSYRWNTSAFRCARKTSDERTPMMEGAGK